MEKDLISKKELLEFTGISYGQLYRWKRKKLIPEDWFIHKSTFTGQETFFPKDQIMERIEKIKSMKDDLSLDELADMFSPNPQDITLTKEEVIKRNIVTDKVLHLFLEQEKGDPDSYPFEKLLYLYILERALQTGEISLEEGKILLRTLTDHYPRFQGKNGDVIVVRKLGVAMCFLVSTPSEIALENGAKAVIRLNIANCMEELKIKVS
jgi:DNA-binding transcriptional MerR regulator